MTTSEKVAIGVNWHLLLYAKNEEGYYNIIKLMEFKPLDKLIKETRERFKDNPLTPEERRDYYIE